MILKKLATLFKSEKPINIKLNDTYSLVQIDEKWGVYRKSRKDYLDLNSSYVDHWGTNEFAPKYCHSTDLRLVLNRATYHGIIDQEKRDAILSNLKVEQPDDIFKLTDKEKTSIDGIIHRTLNKGVTIIEFESVGYAIKFPNGKFLDLQNYRTHWPRNCGNFNKWCIEKDLDGIRHAILQYDKEILL